MLRRPTRRRVIIVSHGNAFDNGCFINAMILHAKELDADCIYYDYEGFGCSDGHTSCDCFERDIRAVYNYALQFFQPKDIFLLGESRTHRCASLSVVGSVPTCRLAASLYRSYTASQENGFPCKEPLGGVILNGAIYNGKEVIPCCLFPKMKDPYNNAEDVPFIRVFLFSRVERSVPSFTFTASTMRLFLLPTERDCTMRPSRLMVHGGFQTSITQICSFRMSRSTFLGCPPLSITVTMFMYNRACCFCLFCYPNSQTNIACRNKHG